ncbi:ATPase [Moheibacter lacus]|uniref:ATPase n=1 Tax=Moheibacter lacus TaxID=2745851 RepID=A0A838ZKN7_9FLAO|nr:ATPase [Moheibacter lacus]MBA5629818.1 ATPase [Moheibacter lacus]
MIAIADSGSTKTDWVILNNDLTEDFRTNTIGFNPYHIDAPAIEAEMMKNEELKVISDKITQVYFYGAGCSADFLKETVKNGFRNYFKHAELKVDHDLLAACYAVYRGTPAIVCILGTGSNACYFDGKEVKEATPSLAYILGDEGSGNHMGKKLLHAYFSKKMPKHLAKKFHETYHLTISVLNINVYQKPLANAYLASFSKFVHENKDEPFIQNLIYTSMADFFENQVLPNREARFSEINFIGSVAHYYEDIIRAVAANYHLEVGHIVRKPIDNLVDYHKKYILHG